MPLAPTPKGLFHVRDPLDEFLDRSGRYLAALETSRSAEPLFAAVHAAETLARHRLAQALPQDGSPAAASGSEGS